MSTDGIENEVRIAIAKHGGQKKLALTLRMDEAELSRKLNNERGWKMEELAILFAALGLKVVPATEEDFRKLIKMQAKLLSEVL